ncbi:tigger transposable element-derived protein 4-like [Eupeodes corollae]|uniref:tigger transposable element-derived protein 4-like n=1 Tax=Eupeodes corollae TaxID=290404 RepID=UPI002493222E|nr:tigger transposable element-derived protein 4-like [Eupeodes corollae]
MVQSPKKLEYSTKRTNSTNIGKRLCKKVGQKNFTCSTAWIQRFQLRHNIVSARVSGECGSVSAGVVDDWPKEREGYTDNQIFNIDETRLFYKMTPNRTLKFKGEKCVGGKMSKERITVLVGGNMTGTVQHKLLVIGKAKNTWCFKNIKKLPSLYESNKRAWMTSGIFEKDLRNWDRQLGKQKETILLLVDNCPQHPNIDGLTSMKLVFLPPNTTSVLQPMDQGTIRSLKEHYRKVQVLNIIRNIEIEKQDGSHVMNFVNVNNNIVTAEFITDEQIIDSVQNENVDSDKNEEEIEIQIQGKIEDALQAANTLKSFVSLTDSFDRGYEEFSTKIEMKIEEVFVKKCRQQKIADFL